MPDELVISPAGELAHVGERDLVLSEATRQLIEAGVPENTRKAYGWRWADFTAFCERELRTALPATEETLAEYVALMVTTPTPQTGDLPAARSVEQAIAAVRTIHRRAGHPKPNSSKALDILNGYKRGRAKRPVGAPPVLIEQLRAMTAATSKYTTVGKRDRVVLVLGWAMAGRRSELVALDVDDVTEVAEGLEVFVRTSKTDKRSEGQVVKIVAGGYPDTDPVRIVREWKDELAQYGVDDGRLLRAVDQWGNLGESLSARHVTGIVKRAAQRAHLPHADSYSAHGLRAGFATQAARNRVPARVLADHGRWSPTSTVVNSYLRAVDDWQNNATRGIGL